MIKLYILHYPEDLPWGDPFGRCEDNTLSSGLYIFGFLFLQEITKIHTSVTM